MGRSPSTTVRSRTTRRGERWRHQELCLQPWLCIHCDGDGQQQYDQGNSASLDGGGIYNASYEYHGGPAQATITLNNSTITGNSGRQRGRGVQSPGSSGPRFGNGRRQRSVGCVCVSGNSASSAGDELVSCGQWQATSTAPTTTCFGDSSQTNAQAFYGVAPRARPTSPLPATGCGTDGTGCYSGNALGRQRRPDTDPRPGHRLAAV